MPALVKRGGDDNVFPEGALHSNLLSLTSNIDFYSRARKRSRVAAHYIINGGEKPAGPQKQTPSLDSLPSECLFEIFRRLEGQKERSTSACVSKRWFSILSSFRSSELSVKSSSHDGSVGSEALKKELPDLDSETANEEGGTFVEAHLTRSLDNDESTDIRLAAMAIGISGRGGLRKLFIRGSHPTRGVTDVGLAAIARQCPSLRSLMLCKLPHVTDAGLLEIVLGCPWLKKLNLRECPLISDKGLMAVAQRCSNLKSLTIEACPGIGNEGLQAIGRCCRKLSCISLKDCPLVGDEGITGLVYSAGSSLTNIKLHNLNIGDMSVAVIGYHGTSLTDLTLTDLQNVKERGFWVMGNTLGMRKLESITITSCCGATDAALQAIAIGCPSLKTLCLRRCCYVSDAGLKAFLVAAKQLESLQLEECHQFTLGGVLSSILNSSVKLKTLALVKCVGIKDMGSWPTHLPSCMSLRSLTISNCPGFTSHSLIFVGRIFPQLQEIDLSGLAGVTDKGVLSLIANSRSYLVKVNLQDCVDITDDSVVDLVERHGATLQYLNIAGCKNIKDNSLVAVSFSCQDLVELVLADCGISDYGVAVLASARQLSLRLLSLAGCKLLTHMSLPLLGNMGESLMALNLQRCDLISAAGIALLEKRMQWCDILS